MNTKTMLMKHLNNTLRKREFWFTILIYPAMAAGYLYLKGNPALKELVHKTGIWYFVISFLFYIYITVYVFFEVIEKKLHHKAQGDKLRIKQEQQNRR